MDTVERRAGRLIVVDAGGRVLVLSGSDPARPEVGTWWFTPGGGAEAGESYATAARRELAEETGLVADELGEAVHERVTEFEFDGRRYRQDERYYLVRVESLDVDTSAWSELERGTIAEWRWCTPDDLDALPERVYPEGLADLVRRLA